MGECLEVNQEVMLKVAQGGLLEAPLGWREGRKGTKIRTMRRKGSLASEKGQFKRTGQCPTFRGVTVLTKGMKSLSEGMRNQSAYEGWSGIWSCKQKVGAREGTMGSKVKGRLVSRITMEQGPINQGLISIGTAHENMQTKTRFPWKRGDLEIWPWML